MDKMGMVLPNTNNNFMVAIGDIESSGERFIEIKTAIGFVSDSSGTFSPLICEDLVFFEAEGTIGILDKDAGYFECGDGRCLWVKDYINLNEMLFSEAIYHALHYAKEKEFLSLKINGEDFTDRAKSKIKTNDFVLSETKNKKYEQYIITNELTNAWDGRYSNIIDAIYEAEYNESLWQGSYWSIVGYDEEKHGDWHFIQDNFINNCFIQEELNKRFKLNYKGAESFISRKTLELRAKNKRRY